MNKIFKLFMVGLLTLSLTEAIGQTYEAQYLEQRDYQKEFYSDYSRWSLGAYVGPGIVWGDARSFAYDKTYIGVTTGIATEYQVSPTVGLKFSVGYSYNKTGAKSSLEDFYIAQDGYLNFGSEIPEDSYTFGNVYGKINAMNFALSTDIDIRNLFWGNDGSKNRRWAYLVSPTISLQYFRPTLYTKANAEDEADNKFTQTPLHYDWTLALGGDIGARYKLSPRIDLEGRVGAQWVTDNKFDGVSSATERRLNGIGYLTVGFRYKFNVKKKGDNLAWAPTRNYVRKQFEPTVVEKVITETKIVEVPVEKIVEVEAVVDEIPEVPSVHFLRGSAVIDEELYEEELFEIVRTLKKYPDADFEIWGYADHTGTERINDKISLQRAEALQNYLVDNGISKSRIVRLYGKGEDIKLSGEAALSIKARRATVMNH